MSAIQSVGVPATLPALPASPVRAAEGGESFMKFLLDSIEQVGAMQAQADQSVESLFTGGEADPAEVLTAVQKADLAFKMMMQVRNKLVQVYQEVKDIRI